MNPLPVTSNSLVLLEFPYSVNIEYRSVKRKRCKIDLFLTWELWNSCDLPKDIWLRLKYSMCEHPNSPNSIHFIINFPLTKFNKQPFFLGLAFPILQVSRSPIWFHPCRGEFLGALLRQDWFSYACPKFVAASMPDLESFSATDRWVFWTWTLDIHWINGTLKTYKNPKNHDCLRGNVRFWRCPNHSILGEAYFQASPDLRVDGHYGNWPWLWEQVLSKDEDPQEESFFCGAKSRAPGFQFIPCHSDLIHRWLVWNLVFKHISRHSQKWFKVRMLTATRIQQPWAYDSYIFIWSHSLSNNIVQYSLFTWVNLPLQRQTLLFPEAYNFGDNFGSGWNMFLDNGWSYHGIYHFFC